MNEDVLDVLRGDSVLGEVIDQYGWIGLDPSDDPFERLVVSIINQQLSGASAEAIRGRVFERFEITPEVLLEADEDALRETGLSRQKIDYIRNVAEAFGEDGLSRETLAELTDDEVIERLTSIRGIGVWTGKMFLMFCLGREDVFPVEDLGIRRGMELLYGLEEREAMIEKAETWRPYRSYASRYIWRVND